MALNIDCKKCKKMEVVNEAANEAYCSHYNAEIALDKHLDNCPGGEFITQPPTDRKDPRPKKSGDQPDVMALLEGFNGDMEAVQKRLHAFEERQDDMERKFDQLLGAVKGRSAAEPTPEGDPSTPAKSSQPAPPGATRRPIKKPTKKKTKKKVDAGK